MTIGVALNKSSVAIKQESPEGTYVEETASEDFIQVLQDGLEFSPAKELIEREILTADVEQVAPRTGQRTMSGTIPVEWKAGSASGDAPETNDLYESLMGGVRQLTSPVTSKAGSHTSTQIELDDGDGALFKVGDIVLVKEAGKFEVRPISAVSTTPSSNSITFPFALDNGAPSSAVVIEEFTTYFPDSDNSPPLSVTRYIGGEIREKAIGMRAITLALNNFTTGQVANMAFGLDGLNFDREDGAPLFTPAFDTSKPPVILGACVFIDGVKTEMNNLSLSIENEVGFITSTCSENGRISSRITNFKVTGSVDPYMDDTTVDNFDKFTGNDDVSIFAFASNPTAVAGENNQFVAIWIPIVKFIEAPIGDQEGIATDAISFQGARGSGNDTIFLGFI